MNRVNAWIDAAQANQPEETLAIFIYARDGKLYVGRGEVPLEMKKFPLGDLCGSADEPKARELIVDALEKAFEAGPTDEAQASDE